MGRSITLRDLTLTNIDRSYVLSVKLQENGTHVVLEDINITGDARGGIWIEGGCTECSVTVRRAHIEIEAEATESQAYDPLGRFAKGLLISGVLGTVLIEDLSVTVLAPPSSQGNLNAHGVYVPVDAERVEIADVRVRGPAKGSLGFGVGTEIDTFHLPLQNAEVRGLDISGFDYGIRLNALRNVTVSDAKVVCGVDGIHTYSTAVSIDNVSVAGCREHGIYSFAPKGAVVERTSAERSRIGIHVSGSPERISQVELRDNSYIGLHVGTDAQITDTLFCNNSGKLSADSVQQEYDHPLAPGAALLVAGPGAVVRGSVFHNSAPYAVYLAVSDVTDLRNNWWGSAAGPVINPMFTEDEYGPLDVAASESPLEIVRDPGEPSAEIHPVLDEPPLSC